MSKKEAFGQRAQVYTDGLSGSADNSLERAFHPVELKAGLYKKHAEKGYKPHEDRIEQEKNRLESLPNYRE